MITEEEARDIAMKIQAFQISTIDEELRALQDKIKFLESSEFIDSAVELILRDESSDEEIAEAIEALKNRKEENE